MKLSIVMPVYNERATLEEIVRLVRTVDLTVDPTGSNPKCKDPSCSNARLFWSTTVRPMGRANRWRTGSGRRSRAHHPVHAANSGKGAAARTGFSHATGDLLVIQDADWNTTPLILSDWSNPSWKGGLRWSMGVVFRAALWRCA
jgi:glycosyltransferase involved in cell wall biosynthesis